MSRRGQILFFIPAFLLFLVFVLIPTTQTWIDSFFIEHAGKREFAGALFYRYAIMDSRFHESIIHNLIYLGWTLLFEVTVGLLLAVGLERQTRFNHFLRVAFFSPAMLSLVVVGLVFGFMFKDGIGLLPGMLREGRALLTISVVSGWASAGFFMVIFLAGLAAIPEEVLEAAMLDGANGWQTFWRIKLPLLKEVLAIALLICFTGAFKAFDLFWVLVPNQDYASIVSTQLVKEVVRFNNRGYGSTLAVLLTVMVVAIALAILGVKRVVWGKEAQ